MYNPDLNIKLLDQLPPWYREVLDYQEMCQTEQAEIDALSAGINAVWSNFFLQTMDEGATSMWEAIFGITAIPGEDLDFRRDRVINRISSRPPYTMAFLHSQLDRLLGAGNYTVTMDYPNYTLYIESAAENIGYSQELAITIGRIKPAHIVYISVPNIRSGLALSETISGAEETWNYRLGSWALYSAPFLSILPEEVIKMPETPSIQAPLISGVASFVAGDIAGARINGTVTLSDITKTVENGTVTVTYDVTSAQANEITQVELLDTAGTALTSVSIYAAVGSDGIKMKHTIPIKEGT